MKLFTRGWFNTDDVLDLTFEEQQGIGPDGSLFEGDADGEEEMQTRPSPDSNVLKVVSDCGPLGDPFGGINPDHLGICPDPIVIF